jgi:hypothetical protein
MTAMGAKRTIHAPDVVRNPDRSAAHVQPGSVPRFDDPRGEVRPSQGTAKRCPPGRHACRSGRREARAGTRCARARRPEARRNQLRSWPTARPCSTFEPSGFLPIGRGMLPASSRRRSWRSDIPGPTFSIRIVSTLYLRASRPPCGANRGPEGDPGRRPGGSSPFPTISTSCSGVVVVGLLPLCVRTCRSMIASQTAALRKSLAVPICGSAAINHVFSRARRSTAKLAWQYVGDLRCRETPACEGNGAEYACGSSRGMLTTLGSILNRLSAVPAPLAVAA